MKKNRIPWPGIVISSWYLLAIFFIIYQAVKSLTAYALAFIVLQNPKVGAQFIGGFPAMLMQPMVELIFIVLIMAGVMYGRRIMGIIVTIIVQILFLLTMILNLFKLIFSGKMGSLGVNPIGLFLGIFIGFLVLSVLLWLSFKCLQHPYYGGDGRKFEWGSLKSREGWRRLFLGEKAGIRGEEMTTF